MSLFTSKREKNLWLWVLAMLIGIYSTLGIAQPVSNVLRESGLLGPAFMLGMFLVLTTMLVYALKKRPRKSVIGVILGIIAVYLMVFVRMEIPEERTHLIEYGVVAVFIYQALLERMNPSKGVWIPTLFAILFTTIAGTLDECIQAFLPTRVFDGRDILFNFLAALMAIGSNAVLNWVRSRTDS